MRAKLPRIAAYAVVVVASALAGHLSAQQAVKETATISYWNAVDGCFRGNKTVRRPLHDFAQTFYTDESRETDDPEVVIATEELRDATYDIACLTRVQKVGPADDYVRPADR